MKAPAFWFQPPATLAWALSPLGSLVTVAGRMRQRLRPTVSADVPVIVVGNLVLGGQGKTPVVQSLVARIKKAQIEEVHVLARGYGGRLKGPLKVDPARHTAADVGDEPLEHAQRGPCWIARDRLAGARAAAAAGARLIVMDDGFQNPRLAKDLSLLVIDTDVGFGNGRVLPAGPLREPVVDGLARANAVVLLGSNGMLTRAELPTCLPVLVGRLVPSTLPEELAGRRYVAFAGIGRPAKFFATVRAAGAQLCGVRAFPDHHRYRDEELAAILAWASQEHARPLTTSKDWVRLPPKLRPLIAQLPVVVAWDDAGEVDRLLGPLLLRASAPPYLA